MVYFLRSYAAIRNALIDRFYGSAFRIKVTCKSEDQVSKHTAPVRAREDQHVRVSAAGIHGLELRLCAGICEEAWIDAVAVDWRGANQRRLYEDSQLARIPGLSTPDR